MTFLEQLQAQTGLLNSQIRQSSPFATYTPTSERTIQGVPQNYFDPATNQFMMPEMTGMGGTMSGVGTGFGTGTGTGFGTYTPGAFGQFYGSPVGTGGSIVSPTTTATGSTVGGGGRSSSPNPTAYNFPNYNMLPGTVGLLGLINDRPVGTQFSWNEQTQSYQPTAFVNQPEDVTSWNVNESTMTMDEAGNVTYGRNPYGISEESTGTGYQRSTESLGDVDHPGRPNPVTGLGMLGPGFAEATASTTESVNPNPTTRAGYTGTSDPGYGDPGNFGAANAAARGMGFAGAVGQTDPNTGVVSAVTDQNGIPVGYGERGDNGGGQGFGGDTGVGQDAGTMGGTGGRRGGAGQNGGSQGGGMGGMGGATGGGFCFDPETLVVMLDGTEKKIKHIVLGDKTRGGEVTGVFQFKAADEIHDYKGVTVAGSHYVKENGNFIMVQDSPLSVKINKIPVVYSLDTTQRRIWIKDIEFADYNGDSIAKSFLHNAGVGLSGFDKEVLRQVENRLI